MSDHDPLCPWAREVRANRDRADCPFCPQIEAVRADERERMRDRAATGAVRRTEDGLVIVSIDDPYGMGWLAVSIELFREMVDALRAGSAE